MAIDEKNIEKLFDNNDDCYVILAVRRVTIGKN